MKLPASLAAMPMRSKLGLAGGALAVVVALFMLLRIAGAPSYTLLASGLDPADAGKVTAALDDQAIGYELQANGTSVAVEKGAVGRARIALASAGVNAASGSNPGFSLFDQQKLGASDFQQQVTYQRALEGEIANTINSVSGVSGAKVQLVLPQDDLFQDTSTPATAAVLLENSGETMEPGAVRGIAQLTASSVKGLKTDNVTITDGSGQTLWPSGDGGADGAAGGSSKQAAEARKASQIESKIDAMLVRTLGPGKGSVQVNADLNMDKVTRDELTYAKKGTPLKTTSDVEKLSGGGSTGAGGTAGTGGNIPQYTTGTGNGGSASGGNYNHTTKSTDFGVDKTVAKVEQATGQVQKLQVALMLDKSVPAAQATQIKNAVATAAGIDATRGDVITLATVAFPKQTVPKAGPIPTTMLAPAKWAGLGLAVLLFLFFTRRALKKRENAELPAPAWITEITEPVRLSELEGGAPTRQLSGGMPALAAGAAGGLGAGTGTGVAARRGDDPMAQLEGLVDQEPARVAAQVRSWMQED
jgi:flagellar M-ring protein FliF